MRDIDTDPLYRAFRDDWEFDLDDDVQRELKPPFPVRSVAVFSALAAFAAWMGLRMGGLI